MMAEPGDVLEVQILKVDIDVDDITQLVDGNVGMHTLLPKKIFTGTASR